MRVKMVMLLICVVYQIFPFFSKQFYLIGSVRYCLNENLDKFGIIEVSTSSAMPCFTRLFSNRYRLLFPFPFGSRLVVHLGVLCPELRPHQVAILSVHDTAHTFELIRLLDTQAIVIGTTIIEPFQLVWLGRCLLGVLAFATSKPVRLKP